MLEPSTRVVAVELDDGTVIVEDGVVVPGADLTVVTIDFLARGGDEYPFGEAPFTVCVGALCFFLLRVYPPRRLLT